MGPQRGGMGLWEAGGLEWEGNACPQGLMRFCQNMKGGEEFSEDLASLSWLGLFPQLAYGTSWVGGPD